MADSAKRHRVSTHPDVNFTVVVNPGSGPGPDALPDANYTREVPKLASYDNVRLLGYVATTYANRNISLVRRDIETYAAWPTNSSNPKLAVRGIFFDETPQQYDLNTLAYLQELTAVVKSHPGLGPDNYVRETFLSIFPVFSLPCRPGPSPYMVTYITFLTKIPVPGIWETAPPLYDFPCSTVDFAVCRVIIFFLLPRRKELSTTQSSLLNPAPFVSSL